MAAHADSLVMIGRTFGHYLITERIGAGGMGEVYRAHDHHLERDVALKLLPGTSLLNETARKRFRDEALALSKLNHPNIATIFDYDTHDGVDFLAMELIQGSPMSSRVGQLTAGEIFRLGIQLAHGLAAAHAAGVIHRDLKPANLMITPDGRLKILDFGLAILAHPDRDPDLTRTIAETTAVSGTVPYMSPEQLRGQATDARSDIYAAGAVLYELATGQRPFPQTQGAELIGAILYQPPPPPSTRTHRLPTRLESIVMKALEKEPDRRYQSARELLAALETAGDGQTARPLRRPGVAAAGVALIGVALVSALTIGLNIGGLREVIWRRGAAAIGSVGGVDTPVRARRAVAVLGFRNLSGRPGDAWLSTALSEMLVTELAAGTQLRTIPGENVAQMRISLSLTDAESYGRETLAKIRTNLGTDVVVFGSYVTLGAGQIRLDLRLQDAVIGETLAAVSETGSETRIDDLVSRAGSRLRQVLRVGDVSDAEAVAVRATLPSSPEAVRLYSEGLARLRSFDALAARDLLQKAVAADSQYPLAHSALSAAWSSLGYDERAIAEARRAFELSTNLSREERLLVEGRYREMTADWEKAVEIYRTLSEFFPDNLEYGLQLARVQTSSGKARDALVTVDALRRVPPPASADPRIDLAEAGAAAALSDFRRQQTAARTAATKGVSSDMRLLVSRARLTEARASFDLTEHEQSIAAYEIARATYAAAGDRSGVAEALTGIGMVFVERGEFAKGEDMLRQAVAIAREIGNQRRLSASLNALFVSRYQQVDLLGAKTIIDDVLAIFREINDRERIATGLNNLGIVLYDLGDTEAARTAHEESLSIRREIGAKQGVAMSLNNLALVIADRPDLPAAKRMYEEALAIGREIGDRSRVSSSLTQLGVVAFIQGDLPEARNRLEQALAIRNELGLKGLAATTRVHLARVLIDEEQTLRAETLAQEAADEFEKVQARVSEGSARAVLAHAQLVRGKRVAAQQSAEVAAKLVAKSNEMRTRLSVLTSVARVRASLGKTVEAFRSLETILEEARTSRLINAELEARLALGEVETMAGQIAQGRSRLGALEREATEKGFLLIARKARTLSGRSN